MKEEKKKHNIRIMIRNTHQSGSVNKDAASTERDVIAGIEAMPESTEKEHRNGAVYTVIDDKTQPVRSRTIPVVKQLFQAGAQLQSVTEHWSC